MPRGKQNQKPTPSAANKENTSNSQPEENNVTISMSELKTLMRTIAAEVFDEKKGKLKGDIEEECEYQVYIQSVEIEQTFEKFQEELKTRAETVDFKKIAKEQCITTINAEMKPTKEEIEALKKENSRLKRRLERLEFSLSCKDAKIDEMKIKIDEMEQIQYDNSVRIVGMPEEEGGESDINNIQMMARTKFEMDLKSNDIAYMYRAGRVSEKKKCRDLIIKFKKKSVRNQFYNNRKKLLSNNDQGCVYINEQLTEYRANLFFAARKLMKKKKLHSTWSQRGNILVRKTESDKPIHIKHHKHLAEIIGEFDDDEDDMTAGNEMIVSDEEDEEED